MSRWSECTFKGSSSLRGGIASRHKRSFRLTGFSSFVKLSWASVFFLLEPHVFGKVRHGNLALTSICPDLSLQAGIPESLAERRGCRRGRPITAPGFPFCLLPIPCSLVLLSVTKISDCIYIPSLSYLTRTQKMHADNVTTLDIFFFHSLQL